ncbi:MAG: cobalamin biosynthesis protein CobD [Parvularculaceae bacterium]|nr:cobalamin biosynthesis protein CobD [Parvularculaceae bacterium]
MNFPALMLAAWAIEAAIGWPSRLYRHIRHPVVWLGAGVATLERKLNAPHLSHAARYATGASATLLIVIAVTAFAWANSLLLPPTWPGFLVEAFIASSLIASRSLYMHVAAVAVPLSVNDLAAAQMAVSKIVGRDPAHLDEAGIARAAMESLSENASDGVVAPLFWGALFGLPGIAAYKSINTLDSMIGHRNERYSAFGGFAARLDDIANLVPARLTGLLIAAASIRPQAFSIMIRDARRHRSPNAGWPEAAMAGALGVRLSGPRIYGDRVSDEPWLNAGARDPDAKDLRSGLFLYIKAMALGAALLGIAWRLTA